MREFVRCYQAGDLEEVTLLMEKNDMEIEDEYMGDFLRELIALLQIHHPLGQEERLDLMKEIGILT